MPSRLRAFLVHLAISLFIGLLVAALIFGLWYPYPYRELSGGFELFLMIVSIDVILGPLITLAIFNPRKSARALGLDLSVVAAVQLTALIYGVTTMADARPAHMVFEKDLFRIAHTPDIPQAMLRATPPGITALPLSGPTPLGIQLPTDPAGRNQVLQTALMGTFEAFQPALWVPYDQVRAQVWQSAQPVEGLIAQKPAQAAALTRAIKAADLPAAQLRYLPVVGRNYLTWTALVDAQGSIRAYAPFDPTLKY